MSDERCPRAPDPEQWEAWLADGVPPSARAHAEQCPECTQLVADLDQLGRAFAALRAAETPTLDVEAAVMAAVQTRSGSSRWRQIVAAAAAVAAVAVAASVLGRDRVRVVAEVSARWNDHPVASPVQSAPGRLSSGEGLATIELPGPGGRITLSPESELTVQSAHGLSGLSGAAHLNVSAPVALRGPNWTLEASGDLEVAAGDGKRVAEMMNGKVWGAGSALVAVAIYAGWATLSTPTEQIRQEAPGALLLGADGQLERAGLRGSRSSDPAAAVSSRTTAALEVEGDRAAKVTEPALADGAYWSEEDQAIRFALEGEVIDALGGEGLNSFTLKLKAELLEGYAEADHTQQVDGAEQGHFRIDGLGLGRWRITASAEGYAPASQAFDLSSVNSNPYLVLAMSAGGELGGTVVDHRQQPVEGARVGLARCFADQPPRGCEIHETGANGRFTLENVPEGSTVTVRAEHPRLGSAVQPNLQLAPGRGERIVLELSGRVRVFGVVTRGPDDQPAPGMRVVSEDDARATITDAEGRYELLIPLERRPIVHVVVPGKEGRPEVRFASYPERRSAEGLRWVSAPTHVAEVEKDFRLAQESARLSGRVTDAEGNPVTGAVLHIRNTTGWYGGRGHETFPERTETDADGRYAVENILTKAGYTVAYEDEEGRRHPLGYVNIPEAEPVEANFELGSGVIRGRFVDADRGDPFLLAHPTCRSLLGAQRRGGGFGYFVEPRCLEDGRFEIDDLAPGTYVLKARLGEEMSQVHFDEVELTLGPKEIVSGVEVVVHGEQADRWRLRVLDERGRFVPSLYSRLESGDRTYTSSLGLRDDGTVQLSLERSFETLYIDAQGYTSAEIDLRGRDPSELITVTLRRLESAP